MNQLTFERFWSAALLLLIASTHQLWLPADWTGSSAYPSIAMGNVPADWIRIISYAVLPLLTIACAGVCWTRDQGWLWWIIAAVLLVSVVADQHRLQPWVYQSILYATLFALSPKLSPKFGSLWFIRVLTISVYVFSSLGKFDFQFLHTVGQNFLRAAVGLVGMDVTEWPTPVRLWMAAGFPTFELLVAIGLCIPRTRRVAGWMAVAMHVGLAVVLSPLGLSHSPGVLVWNVAMATQAWWLFARPCSLDAETSPPGSTSPIANGFAAVLVLAACLLPLLERGRLDRTLQWDHWLSWALYSPHNSRVEFQIHASAVDQLPADYQVAVADDVDGDRWHDFRLGRFSLAARGVPVLPQARYQWALTQRIMDQANISRQVRGKVQSASDRFNGKRDEIWWSNPADLETAGKAFWLVP